jgi:hypothetical protein
LRRCRQPLLYLAGSHDTVVLPLTVEEIRLYLK